MKYWDYKRELCFIEQQLENIDRSNLIEITDEEWSNCLKLNMNEGKVIKNNPSTNHPYCIDPEPIKEEELLKIERGLHQLWLDEHDYIGNKISTGRGTKEQYSSEIEEMDIHSNRINEINNLLIH